MYLSFFGLQREPFHITPDPDFLYLSPSHKEAVGSIIYGVKQRKGFIKVTGEPGTGKTTILRSYINDIKGERIHPLYLFVPGLRFKQILGMILKGMKIETDATSTSDLLSAVHWGLIELYKKGHLLVLIIDEAQQMSIETLEQVRLLANLETTKEKLMQIVLCGQPEFDEMLQTPELRQLRQRIAVRAVINPLSRRDSIAYIRHRLHEAGCARTSLFTAAAERRIASYAKGSPRAINICCDNALVAGYARQTDTIGWGLARRVIKDLECDSRRFRVPRSLVAGGAAVVALALLFAGGVWIGQEMSGKVRAEDTAVAPVPVAAPAIAVAAPMAEAPGTAANETTVATPAPAQAEHGTYAIWAAQPGETLEDVLRHVHGEATAPLVEAALRINPDLHAGEALAADQKVKIPELAVPAESAVIEANS